MQYPTNSHTITQTFGENPAMYAQFNFPGHNGIDLAGNYGEPIYAAEDGILNIPAPEPQGYGIYCTILKGSLTSYYCHLSAIYAPNRTQVKKGEVIAAMGSSGFSSAPHLHFSLRRTPYPKSDAYKGYIDPLPFLELEPAAPPQESLATTSGGGGTATVLSAVLNIRSAPSILAPAIGTLYAQTKIHYDALLVFENQDSWFCFAHHLYIAAVYQGTTHASNTL